LATVSFVTILTVNFAGENHSIAAMPDFQKAVVRRKSLRNWSIVYEESITFVIAI